MDFIIRRKTLISMLFIGLTMLGFLSYKRLKVELYPNSQLPTLIVQVSSIVELDPSYIETKAIIPLEGSIGTLEDIEEIESSVTSRNGTIYIFYNQKADLKYSYLKLQEKINMVSGTLPDEFFINIIRIDLEQINTMFMDLQVRGTGGADRMRNIAEEEIKPVLENIDGIAGAEIYGGREKSIEVRLNQELCNANNISINQVASALSSNSRDKTYAGRVYESGKRFFVNISAEYNDVTQVGDIIVKQSGPVLLKDIADIYFGVKEQDSYSRVNGLEAVTMSLVYDNQANMIDLSHETLETISRLNKDLQKMGVEIVVQNNNAEIMEKNIDQIINLALLGGLLAVLILWFFLRNIRLVFIIAFSIPVSVYTAFNFFYAAGITINSLTLVGMALAIGMLIDNSVVVLENIYRLASSGSDADEAVKQGTSEVWRSVIAATLTTITVFLPFIFSDNYLVKLIGKNIGVSIVSTLSVSLAVALLLIPMATHFILTRNSSGNSRVYRKLSLHNRMIQSYLLILKASMRKPAPVIIGSLSVFFAVLLISLGLSASSLNEIETPSFRFNITMPGGTSLEKTDALVAEIENRFTQVEEKEDIISRVEEAQATVTVNLAEDWEKESKRSLAEIKNDLNERIKDLDQAQIEMDEVSSSGYSQAGRGAMGGSNPGDSFTRMLGIGSESESLIIKGQDFEKMRNVADDLETFIDELETINSVSVNLQDNQPEVQLHFDNELMSRNNITLSAVASELASFRNEYSSGVKFRDGNDDYDVIIKYDLPPEQEDKPKRIDELKAVQVSGPDGNIMEMDELSDIIFSTGMGNIHRKNQEKSISLNYRFIDEVVDSKPLLESAREEIDLLVAGLNLPAGVAVEVVHEENELRDLYILIGIAIILIFMILAAVFESLSTPVVLMFSIPLAGLGSLISLVMTNNSILNANTLIGFLILLGVVVNNGIILIDYSNILRKRRYKPYRALMMAGLARVRPILITAITTMVAMLPLAMGKEEYVSVIGASFAITVIGGLALSTLLTLVFIPTFYTGLETSLKWIRERSIVVKLLMAIITTILLLLILYFIHSFLWKLITIILTLIIVPSSTWFILSSLKKARETIIPADEPIRIKIQSLVKIYDRESRFAREMKAGKKIRQKLGIEKEVHSFNDMEPYLWIFPALAFLIYFTFFYLESNLWLFVFSLITWLTVLLAWQPLNELIRNNISGRFGKFIHKYTDRFINYLLPAVYLFIIQNRWESIASVIVLGVLWYTTILVYKTGKYLNRENVDIYRLKGRFRKLRKAFYKFVLSTPLIGKKHKPFKALNSVSLDIGTGMFGLLGPNGAGKTTLMRIVCGILEQSYGKIWINGLDVQDKREELQGLIGYLPQEFGTYENMSAYEFLDYQAILKNISDNATRNKRIEYVLKSVHMYERRNEKIGSYSGGMKQRIGIAQILLHLPRILVVDEPTAGLDPRERIRFRNLLVELSRERVVIFSTHIIEDISSSCNKVAVLDKGNLKYLGHPSEMMEAAKGKVWQLHISPSAFNAFAEKYFVVHHMKENEMIRIRCISAQRPDKKAVDVSPNLEDAYLWLLRKSKQLAHENE